MADILFVGDLSWDETFFIPHFPARDEKVLAGKLIDGFGGVAANSAVAAALAGASVAFMGRVGTDTVSSQFETHMNGHGIKTMMARKEGEVCRVVSIVEGDGEKRLVLYPGVSIYPDPRDLACIDWQGIRHVHTAIYGEAGKDLIAMAREKQIGWSLDLEPATFSDGIETLAFAIEDAQVIFVNDRADAVMGGDAVSRLLDMGARAIVRTWGAQGAQYHDNKEQFRVKAPLGLPIKDTTGAGDCLAGWFLSRWLGAGNVRDALEDAVFAATVSCCGEGAQTGYPTTEELKEKKDKQPK